MEESMLITTTESVRGYEIAEYLGICSGQAIYGANVFRDLLAGVTDFIGGRSGAYETVLRDGLESALKDMEEQAQEMGASAVVGVSIDYESIGKESTMLLVAVTGTAVQLR
jgi:uncharacterized protein YbjQ (UPF0145 family)